MSDPAAVRACWSTGDYPAVGERLRPAGEALVASLGRLDGVEVLDVATGTGNVALAAARAGARVVGVDLTPELLAVARRRAADEGLELDLLVGDAESLEFEEDRFDAVASAFGVIFAPRPAVAAGELARVCTPGGRIALTAWPEDGIAAGMSRAVARHVPDADPRRTVPPDWSTPEAIAALFAPRGVELRVRRASVPWRFPSVAAAVDFALDKVAGLRAARPALEAAGTVDDLRADLVALYEERGRRDGRGVELPFDYLLALGVKTG